MWRRVLLSGASSGLRRAAPATAFTAYVSNEKSNTIIGDRYRQMEP